MALDALLPAAGASAGGRVQCDSLGAKRYATLRRATFSVAIRVAVTQPGCGPYTRKFPLTCNSANMYSMPL
jgi:hypothetical protein